MDDLDENLQIEFIETICTEKKKLSRDFGKGRGLNPSPSESQRKAVEKLAAKLTFRDSKEDDSEPFNIFSQPRVILYEGKVHKRSHHALVQHSSRKHLFLLNDIILVTSIQNSSNILSFSSEKYCVSKIIHLTDEMSFRDLSWKGTEENICAFEVTTSDRPYTFVAESESDKRIWLEELHAAVFCINIQSPQVLLPGWNHVIYRGSIHSAAYFGDIELLKYHIDRLNGDSVDIQDENGMCPIHWAALKGHLEAVNLLVEHLANYDQLNDGLNSPLMLAASQGHDIVFMRLLELGADIMTRNIKDRDALFMAALYAGGTSGLLNILQTCTFKGVDLNQVDSFGSAPLHECASRNLARPIKLLVDAGADVNLRHGRKGLTPLQLACSVESPDVETIQSLLDKGAHPNWKDSTGISAFTSVLMSHSARMNKEKAMALRVNDRQAEQSTLDEVASFVEYALPVLMVLVKKGAKYSDECLLQIRPSFRDAINSARQNWEKTEEPEYFLEFVRARGPQNLISREWTSDSSSKHCLMCMNKFGTYSNRRHHCRCCGILCCDPCSSKRLNIKELPIPGSAAASPSSGGGRSPNSSSSSKDMAGSRVCDSCFNTLLYESGLRQQKVLKEAKEKEKVDEEDRAKKKELFGEANLDTTYNNSSNNSNKEKTTSASAGALLAAEALAERGERIQDVAEKSEMLKNAASDYNTMAKKLLQQQQQQAASSFLNFGSTSKSKF